MVRPTSSVWKHFDKRNHEGKNIAVCKYCFVKYFSPNATKMQRHVEKCKSRPLNMLPTFSSSENVPVDYSAVSNVSVIPESTTYICDPDFMILPDDAAVISCESVQTDCAPTVASTSSCGAKKQGLISTFMDHVSSQESDKLDSAFAKAIYSSNCPLSMTDNMYWKKFFNQLRPSYKVPSRHDLTNRLLDNEYMNAHQLNMEVIQKAKFVTIVTDGWSNIRNESIISFIVATPSPVFFKSVETDRNKHTGQYIAEEISKVMKEVGEDKVIALVTDNASNMKAAWRILQTSYPSLNTIGCSAHGLNLLLGDIAKIETFKIIIDRSKDVVKYFKNKQILLSVFTEKQKQKKGSLASTLKLPGETRWSGVLIMFKSLIGGKESLQETVLHETVDRNIRQLVLDNDLFWASVESLAGVLEPICDGITKIESDTAVLSDVCHVFHEIEKSLVFLKSTPLQMEEEEKFVRVFEDRKKMCCQPIHLTAFLLDPRYQDYPLNSDEYTSALEFFSNIKIYVPTEEILADFALFQSREGIYSNEAIWNSAKLLSPLIWWKGILRNQCLSQVAVKIFSMPPSSASCERIFSAFSNTHTVLRNRLSNDRVSKLIAIRSNLILQNKMYSESNAKHSSVNNDSD